jgi:aspartate aminotransferase-like enzyme
VPDWVLAEMAKANDTHRSGPYRELHKAVVENLQKLLSTKNDVIISTSSASGLMEACVRNLLTDDDYGLFLSCGDFGSRWAKMAKACGKNYDLVEVPFGMGFTPEIVQEALGRRPYAAVYIQMNETSTGVLNPIAALAPIIKATGALLCVDAVSCMGGVEIKVDDWGLDVCLASVQKCFAVPPGLAVASISAAVLEKTKTVPNRGWYFDFIEMQKAGAKYETGSTPPIPQIRALLASTNKILEDPQGFYERHRQNASLIVARAQKLGFKMFSPEEFQSPTVCTIDNTLGIDLEAVVNGMLDKNYRIVNGYGTMKGQNFRIAAMGFRTAEEVNAMLDVLEEVVGALRV